MRRAAASLLTACVALIVVTVFAVRAASPGTNPFIDAVSYFNPDSAVMKSYAMSGDATDPGSGFTPAGIWYEFCWPPTSGQTVPDIHGEFLVAPGGALTGSCVANTVDGGAHRESTLTGTYDLDAQTVQFSFTGSQTGIANPHVATMTVTAPVTPVVGDRAEGVAPFTYTCAPGKGSDFPCTFASIEGTVMFAIQLQPTLPSEPPATPQPSLPDVQPTAAPVGLMDVSLACASSPDTGGLSTINCTASANGAPAAATLTYAWTVAGVVRPERGPTMQASALTAGTYEVGVVVTDTSGSAAPASESQFVAVGGDPTDPADNSSLVLIIILLILAGVGATALVAIIRALRRPPKPQA